MKLLLSQKGISLVEVLVAAGALAVVSLGVMKLMETTGKANVKAKSDNDIAQLTREINGLLSSPNSCTASLSGKKVSQDLLAIKQVVNGEAIDKFIVGKVRIGNQFVDPKNQLYVDRIWIKKIDENEGHNNVATIEIVFKRPNSSLGGQDISREITLSTNHCDMRYLEVPSDGTGGDIKALTDLCTGKLVSGPTRWGSLVWGTCQVCEGVDKEVIKHCHAMDAR